MKRIIIFVSILSAVVLTGCQEKKSLYTDSEYIIFSDTLSVNPVLSDEGYHFNVPVTSTVARDYDRTVAVEIIDKGSTAVEGRDYRLRSNTVTIPAGKLSANVEVEPVYEKFTYNDTLSFNLRLVAPDAVKWDMYGDQTKVSMVKVCPFGIENFSGYCVVTSMFLYDYPGESRKFQRLVHTEVVEGKENTILMKDFLADGYDITLGFDPEDPLNPELTMKEGQVICDEQSVFGQMNGDNRVLASLSPNSASFFNTCENFAALWLWVYVYDMSQPVGTVGQYYHLIEWISDEEAERLKKEEGM